MLAQKRSSQRHGNTSKNAFGNTTLDDFLRVLSSASGRDMDAWAAAWLQTSGISTLSASVQTADGHYSAVTLHQDAADPVSGKVSLRPHLLRLGLYATTASGALERTGSVDVDLSGESVEVSALVGVQQPELLLPNDEDLSYVRVRFDEHSLRTVLTSLDRITDPLARALCWSSLWNMTRDAVLSADDYVTAICRFTPGETEDGVLATLLETARTAVNSYTPVAQRDELRKKLLETVSEQLQTASAGSDVKLAWARSFAVLSRATSERNELLRATLQGSGPAGLSIDSDLRWRILQALAANGSADLAELDAELAKDQSSTAAIGHRCAVAAQPEAGVKAAAWQQVVDADDLSNAQITATIEGFRAGSDALLATYQAKYFSVLESVWASRSIDIQPNRARTLPQSRRGTRISARKAPRRSASY
nr:ERAP1-like C-terminal domain-containing protein [Renibacterium salmoninarum]